jgi:ABC-type uncharacterized transport system ATPase subunit
MLVRAGSHGAVTGAPAAALSLTGITKRFGAALALDDVDFVLRPGTVHALLGENGAGKSTLLRIAYGMLLPDVGTVAVQGVVRRMATPADAIAAGIGMVHQHFTLVPAMTVAENIALGGRGRLRRATIERAVVELSEATGFALDPHARVDRLPVGAQQRVEIAKALGRRARVLVLDEPTGVLAPAEVDDLLRWLRRYADAGQAAVLITHKLREALAVADDVTVLRRGRVTLSGAGPDLTEAALTDAMLGEPVGTGALPILRAAPRAATGAVRFRADAIDVADAEGVTRVRGASFEISSGELVGVVGVDGSGQRDLLRALAGRASVSAGTLVRPEDVGFVPEDRHRDAVLVARTLVENVALRGAGRRRGRLSWSAMRERTRALVSAFEVLGGGVDQPLSALSGGNQQKLVLARELVPPPGRDRGGPPRTQDATDAEAAQHPRLARAIDAPQDVAPPLTIVVENPTRGLDVRAAAVVRRRLQDAAAAGAVVVVYSSDLDEVLGLAQRVLVVFDGTVRSMPPDRAAIGRAMLGLRE